MKKNIFLTGYPGVGKTTIIKKIVAKIESAGGFYTEEVLEGKNRQGFKIITLQGNEGILAHKRIVSPYRVGKYGVNIKDLEAIGVESILEALKNKNRNLIIIDEIGKMELFSVHFQDAVIKALDSSKKVLGTIHMKLTPFTKRIKDREDIEIVSVNTQNRDNLPDHILTSILRDS